jgi:CheY-like chemotaxis protein
MHRGKILIIDDEEDVREAVKLHLESAGMDYDFLEAENGEEVIQILNKECNMMDIAIAICDIRMPKINGIECIKFLRQEAPGIPVIVLTGYPDPELAAALTKKGIQAYLVKPINKEKLVGIVQKFARSISDWSK